MYLHLSHARREKKYILYFKVFRVNESIWPSNKVKLRKPAIDDFGTEFRKQDQTAIDKVLAWAQTM